jgi:hypothetical protein
MLDQPAIRLKIIRAIERQIREGRPEIAVLIVALCSSAVTLCTALIASILLAAVIEMRTPFKASYRGAAMQHSRSRATERPSKQHSLRNPIAKLFVNTEPGRVLTGRLGEFRRTWTNQDAAGNRHDKGLQMSQPDAEPFEQPFARKKTPRLTITGENRNHSPCSGALITRSAAASAILIFASDSPVIPIRIAGG